MSIFVQPFYMLDSDKDFKSRMLDIDKDFED